MAGIVGNDLVYTQIYVQNLNAEHTFNIVTNISTKCKYSTYLKICLFLSVTYYVSRCSVLIVISLFVNYRLCGCSVLIEKLLLANYKLYRYSVLTVMLMLVSYSMCAGADPGLILGCCKILQKIFNVEMMQYAEQL